MKGSEAILFEAKRHLGMHGRPNAATTWYSHTEGDGYLAAAWCDMFVSWVASRSGQGKPVGKYAYTPSHVNYFKAKGEWKTKPKRGAIVFFNWDGGRGGQAQHVGIVEGIHDGYIVTIEGNTGDAVKRKSRDTRYVIGYGYPAYVDFAESGGGGTDPAYPGSIIYPGDKGEAVRTMKKRLRAIGYKSVIVGTKYGKHAVAAVKNFQKKRGLEVDGRVGPKTWKELWK